MTAEQFVSKEFKDFEDMSHDDWLRKMQEYAVIKNSKVNLDAVLEMASKQDNKYFALKAAVSALYLKGSREYEDALNAVVKNLAQITWEQFDNKAIEDIYRILNPNS